MSRMVGHHRQVFVAANTRRMRRSCPKGGVGAVDPQQIGFWSGSRGWQADDRIMAHRAECLQRRAGERVLARCVHVDELREFLAQGIGNLFPLLSRFCRFLCKDSLDHRDHHRPPIRRGEPRILLVEKLRLVIASDALNARPCFCRLKSFRGVATRYDKLARNYLTRPSRSPLPSPSGYERAVAPYQQWWSAKAGMTI